MSLGAIPAWITDNPSYLRPTEIFVPVMMKVGPVWSHPDKKGGWFAALEAAVDLGFDSDGYLWECHHIHPSQDEAWVCAEAGAKVLAETLLEPHSVDVSQGERAHTAQGRTVP